MKVVPGVKLDVSLWPFLFPRGDILSGTDLEKLRVLLSHWLEHNAAHADDYRAWVERVQAAGAEHVGEHLTGAIAKLAEVNRALAGALQHLGGELDPGVEHAHPREPHDHGLHHDLHGHTH